MNRAAGRPVTAAGSGTAAGAVFILRLFTACLPPVWGWVTPAWMRRRGYI